jgi:hypothetical protein
VGMKDRYSFDFLDRRLSTDRVGSARIAGVDAVFSCRQAKPRSAIASIVNGPSALTDSTSFITFAARRGDGLCERRENSSFGEIPGAYMAHPWRRSDEILWIAF